MDISKITLYNSKEDYTPEAAITLEQAYHTLTAKSQGEELTLEEVRVIVGYKRYVQDGNFKIVAEKVTKAKVPRIPKEPKPKKPKALTVKEKSLLLTIQGLVDAGTLTLESLPLQQQDFYTLNKDRL